LIDEVPLQVEPWIDLWRDTYAFVASRVAAGLRGIMEKAGAKRAVMPLPAFMQACEAAKLSLTGPGLVALSAMAFSRSESRTWKRLQPHVALSEYELTAEDCHVVRNNFDYPKFDEYTYPSADLQLAAASTQAIAHGDYQWILAELHPPPAFCITSPIALPDKPTLNDALAKGTGGKPNFHFGFFAADFTAHTAVRLFDAMPELSNFVAHNERIRSGKKFRLPMRRFMSMKQPATFCVRKIDNHEHLGSFAGRGSFHLDFIRFNLE